MTENTVANESALLELYLEHIRNVPPLSESEKETLPRLLKEKDSHATARMVDGHLQDVLDVIREYRELWEEPRAIQEAELIQEGYSGLIYAVKTFDWDHPEDFPAHMYNCIGLSLDDLVRQYMYRFRYNEELIRTLNEKYRLAKAQGQIPPVSLPNRDPDYTERLEQMIVEKAPADEIRRYMAQNGAVFTDPEWQAMALRMGLGDGKPRCIKVISDLTGLSMEQIYSLVWTL